ncbi:MAG: phage major capsid protein, partial [Deltaproteobacteria bacterium]|nr:phage major capsid protein [Deltaproteobacteria bacterium]
MNEEDFKKLEGKVGEAVATKFSELSDEMRAGLLTEDQLKTELETFAKSEDIEEVNKLIDTKIEEVLVEVKKAQRLGENAKPKSIGEQMESHKDAIEAFANRKSKSLSFELKTNVTTGSITDDNQGVSIPGFNLPAHRAMPILDLFRRVTLPKGHHGTVYYTDQTTTTRNAATKDEAAAAPESAIAWTRRNISMEKILDSIPLTWETMRYMPELVPEVENFINLNMMLEWENQLLTGDNSAPNWAGAYATYGTDFTQAIATA